MDPSGFGSAPMGEMWLCVKGGYRKGPAVCSRCTSLQIASVTPAACMLAELLLRGAVSVKDTAKTYIETMA